MFFFPVFGLCTLLLIVPRYFLFSVVLGRSEVVYVVQVASSGSTLFLLVLGRFQRFSNVLACFKLFTFKRLYCGSSCCQV